jgi:hypothetical protein
MTSSATYTSTYSVIDVENVIRKLETDLNMIRESSGAITVEKVKNYMHDILLLAKEGYLAQVDLTLFDGDKEIKAAVYTVNTNASGGTASRAGGVIWPKV